MRIMKSKLFWGTLSAFLLVCLLVVLYFLPLTVNDHFIVWVSNHRFTGLSDNNTDLFFTSKITSQGSDSIEWAGNGLEKDAYVGNISSMSLCDGLLVWVNDSLNLFDYPLVGESDHYSNIYLNVVNVTAEASKEGTDPIPISYFSYTQSPASVYVDLNQTEAILGIKGNESYSLSISMVIGYYLSIPALPSHSNDPSTIVSEKTIDLGQIVINCTNGLRNYAHIDFPYQEFSYSVTVPYVKTLIPFS